MIPKISVIVPVYNSEKYLRECLDSIANQTLGDIQVLMIDDGSTDSSASICKEYADKYYGFEYYYKENGGTATARNVGLENAKGEYIGFVDSDDYIELDMFEKMYTTGIESDSDIVFCVMYGLADYVAIDVGVYEFNDIVSRIFPKLLPHIAENGTFRALDSSNCSRIYKRELIQDNAIKQTEKCRLCEDFMFAVETTMFARRYAVIDEGNMYHYRKHADSKSRAYGMNMWYSVKYLMLYLRDITQKYAHYNFTDSIFFCEFYFSVYTIRNEIKNPDRNEAIQKIYEVLNDEICATAVANISPEGMNKEYSDFYEFIKNKDAKGIYKYCNKQDFKKKKIAPILNKLFKNKFIMNLYMKVRGE